MFPLRLHRPGRFGLLALSALLVSSCLNACSPAGARPQPVPAALNAQAAQRPVPLKRFAWSRSAQQTATGFYYQPAAICDDYPEESTTPAKIRRDFETMKALGVKQLRFAFGWDSIEVEPGTYDWGFWDDLVKLSKAYGITLIPYVCYSPEWSNDGGGDFWRTPPEDPKAFGNFMQVIVNRYKDTIKSWELWNEPDLQAYWLGSSDQFATMIKHAALKVREADPNAVVVLGGMSNGRSEFFDPLISKHHLERYVDVLNLHGYHETWHAHTTEDYPEHIRHFSEILPKHQPMPDIWLAEFGYSNWRFSPTSVSQWGIDAIYAYEHTPRFQAVSLFRQHVMALAAGNLSLSAWYRINDLTPGQGVIGDDNNKYLGVLDVQGRPKPAFHALRLYNGLYGRPVRRVTQHLKIQAPAHSQAVVEAFETDDGRLLISAWLRSSTRDEVADQTGQAVDRRNETLNLSLPTAYGTLRNYAISGEMIPAQARLAGQTLSGITLTGGEVWIGELAPVSKGIK